MDRFNELLEENDISPKLLSLNVGVSIKTVYDWKKGKHIFLSNLISLCDYLNCSIDFIAGRCDNVLDFTPQNTPNFYEAIRKVMSDRKITTYKLRKDTRFDGSYFARWKKGAEPYLSTLIELADYFGCTVDQLVGRER